MRKLGKYLHGILVRQLRCRHVFIFRLNLQSPKARDVQVFKLPSNVLKGGLTPSLRLRDE